MTELRALIEAIGAVLNRNYTGNHARKKQDRAVLSFRELRNRELLSPDPEGHGGAGGVRSYVREKAVKDPLISPLTNTVFKRLERYRQDKSLQEPGDDPVRSVFAGRSSVPESEE